MRASARACVVALLCALFAAASCAPAAAAPPLAMRYVLHELALPAGSVLAGDGFGGTFSADEFVRSGPRTIALGANGAVAAVVADAARSSAASRSRIVVWRADGSRVTIGLPDDAALHAAFHQYAEGDTPFPYVSFARVVLASDGTPFATVANMFSGAYSGTAKGVFRWTGRRWENVGASGVPHDLDVVAAELPAPGIGVTGDFSSSFLTYDEVKADPAFQRPQAIVFDGTTARKLGTGTLTALAGPYACGFVGEQEGQIMPDNVNVEGQIPYALLWHDGAATRLGRGRPFGVNASGVVVGDDRVSVPGGRLLATRAEYERLRMVPSRTPPAVMPVRWDARGAHVLGREQGTAFAIAPDGTIVGTFARGGGFVSRDGTVTELDTLVRGTHAHIRGAYAIDPKGRILVLTERTGTARLAYLDPGSP